MEYGQIYTAFYSAFLLSAVITAIITIGLHIDTNKKVKTCKRCTGKIVDFLECSHRKIPIAEYYIDNKMYTLRLIHYNFSLKKGDYIKLLYDESSPETAVSEGVVHLPEFVTSMLSFWFFMLYFASLF